MKYLYLRLLARDDNTTDLYGAVPCSAEFLSTLRKLQQMVNLGHDLLKGPHHSWYGNIEHPFHQGVEYRNWEAMEATLGEHTLMLVERMCDPVVSEMPPSDPCGEEGVVLVEATYIVADYVGFWLQARYRDFSRDQESICIPWKEVPLLGG